MSGRHGLDGESLLPSILCDTEKEPCEQPCLNSAKEKFVFLSTSDKVV